MGDYPSWMEGKREERDEGWEGKKRKNMKRGYVKGKGIKQTRCVIRGKCQKEQESENNSGC